MGDIAQHPSNPTVTEQIGSQSSATVKLVPVTETIIVPAPWYKRVFGPVTRTETVWKLTFLSLVVIGILIGQSMVNKPTKLQTQAAVGKAKILLFPQSAEMPPEKPFQLWVSADMPIKKSTIVLVFNPDILQLYKDVTLIGQSGYQLTVTRAVDANKTGIVQFDIAPQNPDSIIPEGTFQLGSFTLTPKAKVSSTSTTITVNEIDTNLENQDSIPFAITTSEVQVHIK